MFYLMYKTVCWDLQSWKKCWHIVPDLREKVNPVPPIQCWMIQWFESCCQKPVPDSPTLTDGGGEGLWQKQEPLLSFWAMLCLIFYFLVVNMGKVAKYYIRCANFFFHDCSSLSTWPSLPRTCISIKVYKIMIKLLCLTRWLNSPACCRTALQSLHTLSTLQMPSVLQHSVWQSWARMISSTCMVRTDIMKNITTAIISFQFNNEKQHSSV